MSNTTSTYELILNGLRVSILIPWTNREKEDTEIRLIRRPHADTQTDTQTARHRRRLVVNGWSVHAPQHIRFGTLEVCLQNAPGSLPSRSGLLGQRGIGMQGGLTSLLKLVQSAKLHVAL